MSTRFRTKRPQSWVAPLCAVCATEPEERGLCDIRGVFLCSRHGMQSRRHCERQLRLLAPRLAALLAERPYLSWIKCHLRPNINLAIVKFRNPRGGGTYIRPHIPQPPQRKRHSAANNSRPCKDCAVCGERFSSRADVRRFAQAELCRTCYERSRRCDVRANAQFRELVGLIRQNRFVWLLRLLSDELHGRCVSHLAHRQQMQRDRSDWV